MRLSATLAEEYDYGEYNEVESGLMPIDGCNISQKRIVNHQATKIIHGNVSRKLGVDDAIPCKSVSFCYAIAHRRQIWCICGFLRLKKSPTQAPAGFENDFLTTVLPFWCDTRPL